MKKFIISLACCAALLCGCNKSNTDSAKIDDLSRKLDIAINNEIVLAADIAAIKNQVTNLPSWNTMNNTAYYYHTNMINFVLSQNQDIQEKVNAATARMFVVTFTNMMRDSGFMLDQLQDISLRTSAIEFSLTNWPPVSTSDKNLMEMESEMSATKDEIHEMDHDLIKIKVQLGIPN